VDENTGLSREIEKLRGDVRYLQSDGYIELAARTILLWGRPGEKLIISFDGSTQPPASKGYHESPRIANTSPQPWCPACQGLLFRQGDRMS